MEFYNCAAQGLDPWVCQSFVPSQTSSLRLISHLYTGSYVGQTSLMHLASCHKTILMDKVKPPKINMVHIK